MRLSALPGRGGKRELERLKRIAKTEGMWDPTEGGADAVRFRDQIALLEVDVVALEMLVLRVLSAKLGTHQSPGHSGTSAGQLAGTSNVQLAFKLGLIPLGTMAHEFGQLLGEASTALADGHVTPNELARIQREAGDLLAALGQLLALCDAAVPWQGVRA